MNALESCCGRRESHNSGEDGPADIEATQQRRPQLCVSPNLLNAQGKDGRNHDRMKKKPIRTTAQRRATPEPRRTTRRQIKVETANNESSLAAGTRFMTVGTGEPPDHESDQVQLHKTQHLFGGIFQECCAAAKRMTKLPTPILSPHVKNCAITPFTRWL